MAKSIPLQDGESTITITPKSKNLTYEYSGSNTYSLTFDADFKYVAKGVEKPILGYYEKYFNFAFKNNDDLTITTLFTTDSGKAKRVNTTIKNFFSDDSKDYIVKYKAYSPTDSDYAISTIKPDTEYGINGLYDFTTVENKVGYILGTNKDDKDVLLNGAKGNYIYDPKGNDEYVSEHASVIDYIWDIAGNDKYSLRRTMQMTTGGILYTVDYSGNDEYSALGKDTILYSTDYTGNDKYDLESGSKFWIDDYKGNDYYVHDNKTYPTANLNNRRINDYKGNDKYYLYNANVEIVDQSGKDGYEITKVQKISISEYEGSDKYKINNANVKYANSYKDPDILISDTSGNEKYEITNVVFDSEKFDYENINSFIVDESGKDNYIIDNLQYAKITDKIGNDKYSASNSNNFMIIDKKGNDKYTIDNSEYVIFSDSNKGNDKYTVQNGSYEVEIYDDGGKNTFNVKDSENIDITTQGNYKDTYNITNSSGCIEDYGGNETYTVSKLAAGKDITIDDKDGNKDKLILKDAKKDDIIFMANVGKSGFEDNSLILFNKTTGSYVTVKEFFTRATDGYISEFGDGRIETIKAGKKTLSVDYKYINEIRDKVAGYLSNNETVAGILENQTNNETTIENLIACFARK